MSGWRCLRAQWLHPPPPGLHHWPCGSGGAPPLQVHWAPQGHWQCGQNLSACGCSFRALWYGSGLHYLLCRWNQHLFFNISLGPHWSRSWLDHPWQGGMDSTALCSQCWLPGCCQALGGERSFSWCKLSSSLRLIRLKAGYFLRLWLRMEEHLCGMPLVKGTIMSFTFYWGRNMTATLCWRIEGWVLSVKGIKRNSCSYIMFILSIT